MYVFICIYTKSYVPKHDISLYFIRNLHIIYLYYAYTIVYYKDYA
jgi:hypothetical protein